MPKADCVHSTPPTNTPIDTTRRGFLGGTAAALAAGTAVNVAALATIRPAAAESDPILEAIEVHRAAALAATAVQKRFSAFEDELADNGRLHYELRNDEEGRRGRALEAERDAAYDAETEAACALLNIQATTLAGVIALLEYTRDHDESNYGMGWPNALNVSFSDDRETRTWQSVLLSNLVETLPAIMERAV